MNLRTALVVYFGALSYSQPIISTSTRGEMKPLPDLLRCRAPNICQDERGQDGKREENKVSMINKHTGWRDVDLKLNFLDTSVCKVKFIYKENKSKKNYTSTMNYHMSLNFTDSNNYCFIELIPPTLLVLVPVICSTYLYGEVQWSRVGQGEGVAWVIVRVVLEFWSQDIATFAILHKPPLI